MIDKSYVFKGLFIAILTVASITLAYNQVPSWYKGTPFKGKPQVIPGKIEFENYDVGGEGIAFHQDLRNAPAAPVKNYRLTDSVFMAQDETNTGVNVDKYLDGTFYPGKESPHSYYIGWTHIYDWARYTVNVAKSDDYILKSTFAQGDNLDCGFTISVNPEPVLKLDVTRTITDSKKQKKITLDYPDGGSWHTWVKYDSITTLHLDSGINLIEFYIEIQHLNYDYLEFVPAHK